MGHFSNLEPHQLEALALLAEELAEAGQVIGKILRHGLGSKHPDGGPDNRALLERELGDVSAAVDIAVDLGVIMGTNVLVARSNKLNRIGTYLHHIEILEVGRTVVAEPK